MWALLVQTALLLLVAYFVGVWIGCMLRSLFAPRPIAAAAVPASATGAQSAASAAAAVADSAPEQPSAPPEADPRPVVSTPLETITPETLQAERPSPDIPPETTAAPDPVVLEPSPATPSREPVQPVQKVTIPIEPILTEELPSATGSSDSAVVAARIDHEPEPPGPEPVAPAPPAAAADDLGNIRGIDAATADALVGAGVSRYEQIAAWNEGDVARVNRMLGGETRVQNENWIEQAQMLAAGGLTAFARSRSQGESAPMEAPAVPTANPDVAPKTAPVPQAEPEMPAPAAERIADDDLTLIRGIDSAIATQLRQAMGVRTFTDIARWSVADVRTANGLLASDARIQEQNWIEQAQMLASGQQSTYARLGGAAIAMAVPSEDRGTRVSLPVQSAPAASVDVAPMPIMDSAPTTPTVVTDVSANDEPTTATSATNTDMAQFRSVRSEAYQQARPSPGGGSQDDLKRIRGVGTLIERKLNAMGYTTYSDVANWSRAEVDRISHKLDFHGRIERENWIEQARILASGGQTEFSRRIDRGDA